MSNFEEDTDSNTNDYIDLCSICFESVQTVGTKVINGNRCCYKHLACGACFCNSCFGAYVRLRVTDGTAKVECANCDEELKEEVLENYLQGYPLLQQHYKRLSTADANCDPKIKTCPNCCHLQKTADENTKFLVCVECGREWCFACHAPWHKGMSCKAFKRGSKLFTEWARAKTRGSTNARACPKCGVFIQRSDGCDHMTCPRCKTPFCYLCGQRIISSKLLGDHWSVYSVLGCRYIYKRDRPVQRRAVRGLIFLAMLTSLPVLAVVFISVSPFYGAYRITRSVCKSKQQLTRL